MGQQVCNGASLQCSMGTASSTMVVTPANKVSTTQQPAANVNDNQPLVNIMSFVMCQSLANPSVSSATTAAQGVLTPMPCVPNTTSPWSPGASKAKIAQAAALESSSTLTC